MTVTDEHLREPRAEELAEQPVAGVSLVRVIGEVDNFTATELRDAIAGRLAQRPRLIGPVLEGAAGPRSFLAGQELARDQHTYLYVVIGQVANRLSLTEQHGSPRVRATLE